MQGLGGPRAIRRPQHRSSGDAFAGATSKSCARARASRSGVLYSRSHEITSAYTYTSHPTRTKTGPVLATPTHTGPSLGAPRAAIDSQGRDSLPKAVFNPARSARSHDCDPTNQPTLPPQSLTHMRACVLEARDAARPPTHHPSLCRRSAKDPLTVSPPRLVPSFGRT